MLSGSVKSVVTGCTSTSSIISAVSTSVFSCLPARIRFQPAWPRAMADARPTPLPAPVMMAVLRVSAFVMCCSPRCLRIIGRTSTTSKVFARPEVSSAKVLVRPKFSSGSEVHRWTTRYAPGCAGSGRMALSGRVGVGALWLVLSNRYPLCFSGK